MGEPIVKGAMPESRSTVPASTTNEERWHLDGEPHTWRFVLKPSAAHCIDPDGEEVAAKASKNIAMRTAMARFPFVKPLETFAFAYQPSIDGKLVQQLASCHFIEHGDNIIVLGPPGVAKTRVARPQA